MIKVALVGVGNCASALVQGVAYYSSTDSIDGLIIPTVFGYSVSDISFVAAFDVDASKVGQPLTEAVFLGSNNVPRIVDLRPSDCRVSPSPIMDGLGRTYSSRVKAASASFDDVHKVLEESRPDVIINYLPVGSDEATRAWANICLQHHIGFVNAIPSFIASDPDWSKKFDDAKIPLAGDDVKSQIGATIIHRALTQIFACRGGSISSTYQLNFGGNMDFFNMTEDNRLANKRISKRRSVTSMHPASLEGNEERVHISPTDYVSFLGDNKIAYINMRGTGFAGSPIELELKMSVWDSMNSAGVIVDVIRFVAGAAREGIGGTLPICDYYFKSPLFNQGDVSAEHRARQVAEKESFNVII